MQKKITEEQRLKNNASSAKWRKNNKGKIAEQSKKYYDKNKADILAKQRKYRIENKDKILAKGRKYRIKSRLKFFILFIAQNYKITTKMVLNYGINDFEKRVVNLELI